MEMRGLKDTVLLKRKEYSTSMLHEINQTVCAIVLGTVTTNKKQSDKVNHVQYTCSTKELTQYRTYSNT
jgi:hypothetical protein